MVKESERRAMLEARERYKRLAIERGYKRPTYSRAIDVCKKEKFYFEITLPNVLLVEKLICEEGDCGEDSEGQGFA